MIIDKDTFFQIVEKFEYIPFEQTLAWENYKDESGSHFIHFVDDKSAQIYVAGENYKETIGWKNIGYSR